MQQQHVVASDVLVVGRVLHIDIDRERQAARCIRDADDYCVVEATVFAQALANLDTAPESPDRATPSLHHG